MADPDFGALVAAVLRRDFGVPDDAPWPGGERAAQDIGRGIAAVRDADRTSRNVTQEMYDAQAARAFAEASR